MISFNYEVTLQNNDITLLKQRKKPDPYVVIQGKSAHIIVSYIFFKMLAQGL